MINFQESIIVPKEIFLNLVESKQLTAASTGFTHPPPAPPPQNNNDGGKERGNPHLNQIKTGGVVGEEEDDDDQQEQTGSGRGKKRTKKKKKKKEEGEDNSLQSKNFFQDPEYMSFLQKRRRKVFDGMNSGGDALLNPTYNMQSANNSSDGVKAIAAAITGEKNPVFKNNNGAHLAKLFPPENRFKVYRLLSEIDKHPDIVRWDPNTLELITFGQQHPKSNIVDIISYLIGMNSQAYISENKYVSDYTNGQVTMPLDTENFIQSLQHILGGRKDLGKFTIMLDPRRVGVVKELFEKEKMRDKIDQFEREAKAKGEIAQKIINERIKTVDSKFGKERFEKLDKKEEDLKRRRDIEKKHDSDFSDYVQEQQEIHAARDAAIKKKYDDDWAAATDRLESKLKGVERLKAQMEEGGDGEEFTQEQIEAVEKQKKEADDELAELSKKFKEDIEESRLKHGDAIVAESKKKKKKIREHEKIYEKMLGKYNKDRKQLYQNINRDTLSKHLGPPGFSSYLGAEHKWIIPEDYKDLPPAYMRELEVLRSRQHPAFSFPRPFMPLDPPPALSPENNLAASRAAKAAILARTNTVNNLAAAAIAGAPSPIRPAIFRNGDLIDLGEDEDENDRTLVDDDGDYIVNDDRDYIVIDD